MEANASADLATSGYIDDACLSELKQVLDAEMLRGLISKFVHDTETDLETLDQHGLSDIEMAEIVHRIAGSAAALGAAKFRQDLVAAERALRDEHTAQARDLIGNLKLTWKETKIRLEAVT